jgi:RNA polymerase sigma-70 factor (ECF subfamily)
MDADDRAAIFESVVADVYEPLQRYLRRRCALDDVDDLLNDALLTVWRRLDDLPDGSPLPWCYGVARRCLANHRRAAGRRQRLSERITSAGTRSPSYPWTSSVDAGLQAALDRLPEADGEIIRLWAWEELEPRQIALVLDMTPNAVSVRLGRIRSRLRDELARQDRAAAGHKIHEDQPELEP